MSSEGSRTTSRGLCRMATNPVLALVLVLWMVRTGAKAAVLEELVKEITKPSEHAANKISIVGVGSVGMACAFSLLTQGVTSELALVDINADKVKAELMDLQHGAFFMNSPKIVGSTDYAITANSKLCVVTAGVRRNTEQDRLSLVQQNLELFKEIIPKLVQHSPETILLIVSNPVDIMTYAAWKLSKLPQHRVIGSGTNLDTSRLRFLLSEKLHLSVRSIHGSIIGEHGDTSVPVWSGVNVAGVRLQDLDSNIGKEGDPDNFRDIHKQVVHSSQEILLTKGYTSWAIGLSVSQLAQAILLNHHSVHAVSTAVQGFHGIEHDVFLSLPCVLGQNGVSHVIKQKLTPEEHCQLMKSAKTLYEIMINLNFDT